MNRLRLLHPVAALALPLALAACGAGAPPDGQAPAPSPADTASPDPAAAADAPVAAASATSHWRCGETGVAATWDVQAQEVRLFLSGRRLELPLAVSASGARYADDRGNEFWTRGLDEGRLALDGGEPRDCVPDPVPSPWFQAARRGVAFRAVGSEPGWMIEVGPGDTPVMTALLDYGERNLEVAAATRSADGFGGTAGDGSPVTLRIERTSCADGMSGEQFEAVAELAVGDARYRGCGAYLDD